MRRISAPATYFAHAAAAVALLLRAARLPYARVVRVFSLASASPAVTYRLRA
jgi:hypothetical protein